MNKDIEKFIPIADFLSVMLGDNTEIIVHDLINYKNSIVHIINGHISNRKIGDPITDIVYEYFLNESKDNKAFICNYSSKTIEGRLLYSSTFFIKNDKNEVVGALCFNSDYHKLKTSISAITALLPNFVDDITFTTKHVKENKNVNPQEITSNKIDLVINNFDVLPKRMNIDEKTKVIKALSQEGVFNLRGSVQEVALKLNMSEPSIYRYIKKIRIKS